MNLAQIKKELKSMGFKMDREKSKTSKASVMYVLEDDPKKTVEIRNTEIRGRFQIICYLRDNAISCSRNESGMDDVDILVGLVEPGMTVNDILERLTVLKKEMDGLIKVLKTEGIKS